MENVIEYYTFAIDIDCKRLLAHSGEILYQNIVQIVNSKKFLDVSFRVLNEMIMWDDFEVSKQYMFDASLKWILHDCMNRYMYIKDLISDTCIYSNEQQTIITKLMHLTMLENNDVINKIVDVISTPTNSCILRHSSFYGMKGLLLFGQATSGECIIALRFIDASRVKPIKRLRKEQNHVDSFQTTISGDGSVYMATYDIVDEIETFSGFNDSTASWMSLELLPSQAPIHNMLYMDPFNCIYANTNRFRAGSNRDSYIYCYIPGLNIWYRHDGPTDAEALHTSIHNVTLIRHENVMFYCGGMNDDYMYSSKVFLHDPRMRQHIQKQSIIYKVCYASDAISNNQMYLAGGHGYCNSELNFHQSAVQVYEIRADTWRLSKTMNYGRGNLNLLAYENKLYAVGGGDPWSQELMNQYPRVTNPPFPVEAFDQVEDVWTNMIYMHTFLINTNIVGSAF